MKMCGMNFSKQRLSIDEAKQIDIVEYLSKLGCEPSKIRRDDYWYLSPLREEKTPSFKVNRKLNRWYDHGLGKGGNVIDFAVLYNNCTVGEFLQQLSSGFSFQKASLTPDQIKLNSNPESKINILHEKTLTSLSLLRYLQQRKIPIGLAEAFCKQVKYELNGKEYFGIGFKNDAGGYELRNPYFKASSSPKGITTFNNGATDATVFEGFMDFLFFKVIHKNQPQTLSDFVILNSVSFFEKARPLMEQHDTIRLYLDRDTTGQNCNKNALFLDKKYKDESSLYQHHNDLNDWLINFGKAQNKNLRQKF
jgi:hypothetical protein